MKNKRYFISGVGAADPFTRVQYLEKSRQNDSEMEEEKSEELYLDGPMLNIIRKYLNNNKAFSDIFIYLTEKMEKYKDKYENAIRFLYGKKDVNIKFYPDDFYEEENYKEKLRKKDVHKFSSFYKEIYNMYKHIKNEVQNNKEVEIVVNISSGTPAFKSDMMLMAVTNNLIIEQTSNITNDNIDKLKKYALEKDKKAERLIPIKEGLNYKGVNENEKNIYLIETQFKELIKELLPAPANEKNFDESLNIFETLENKILELLEDEIYDLGDKVNE